MTLQSSGLITMDDIVGEFGGTKPYFIDQYYRNGPRVPAGQLNIPASGLIKFSDFYGASRVVPGSRTVTASETFTLPTTSGEYLNILAIGGGGGGGGGNNRLNYGYGNGAGGGGGAAYKVSQLRVTPGAVVTITIGAAGAGGAQGDGPYGAATNGGRGGDSIVTIGGVQVCLAPGGYGGEKSNVNTVKSTGGNSGYTAGNGIGFLVNTNEKGGDTIGSTTRTGAYGAYGLTNEGEFNTRGAGGIGNTNTLATSGKTYGGGGGGGGGNDSNSATGTLGSSGSSGIVILSWGSETLPGYDSNKIIVTEYVPGTSYYTVPAGVTSIKVNLIGGGGGGAGNINWGDSFRGGGGGAGTDQFGTIIPVTPLEVLTVVVGAHGLRGVYNFNGNYIGGSADSTGTANGSAGGDTYILRGTTVLAKAGGGGGGRDRGVAGATGVNSVAAGVTMGGVYQTITPAVGGDAMNDFNYNEGGKNYTGYGDGGRSNKGYPGNDGAYSGIEGHATIISVV